MPASPFAFSVPPCGRSMKESPPRRPHLEHEERLRAGGIELVAGVDEAGRGPLAGPVVAAAVVLPAGFRHGRLNDSKKLSPERRRVIYAELTQNLDLLWHVAVVEPAEIDRVNIYRATVAAMRQAVEGLARRPGHVLIDGLPIRGFPVPQTALVGGDATSLSIAAASVLAKVTRDRLMEVHDREFPAYGFARHKGYATGEHLAILARHGPCPIHRFTFRPICQPLLPLAVGASAAAPPPVAEMAGASGRGA